MILSENNFWKYRCYIFDLDDTLYDEKTYLFSAYKEISEYLSVKNQVKKEVVEKYLIAEFLNVGRQNIFNKLIDHFQFQPNLMNDLLHILRNHKVKSSLRLFPQMLHLIKKMVLQRKSIYVLTNGNVEQQKNKIKQIEWNGIKGLNFFYANEIVAKPAPDGIIFILNKFNIKPKNSLFIGDSNIDEECAKAGKIDFININSTFFKENIIQN